LLVGTVITIKGVLPSSSSNQQTCEDVETPLLEPSSTPSMDVGSSSQAREEEVNGNQDPSQQIGEGQADLSSSSRNQMGDIEVTKQKLVSSLKVNSRESFKH